MEMLSKMYFFQDCFETDESEIIQWNISAFQPLKIFTRQPKRIRFFIGSPQMYSHATQEKLKTKVKVKLPCASHEGMWCSADKASRILNLRP